MKPGALMMLLGGKSKDDESEPAASSEDSYLSEAFSALKDGDEAGFKEAMKGFKSCKGMEPDEDDTAAEE